MFKNVQDLPGFPQYSGIFQNVSESCKMLSHILYISNIFKKSLNKNVLESSRDV